MKEIDLILFTILILFCKGVFSRPSFQDFAICGLVGSTDVSNTYTEWACDENGITLSNPCGYEGENIWHILHCDGSHVSSIFGFHSFSGICCVVN